MEERPEIGGFYRGPNERGCLIRIYFEDGIAVI